jgi:hypothetical protein
MPSSAKQSPKVTSKALIRVPQLPVVDAPLAVVRSPVGNAPLALVALPSKGIDAAHSETLRSLSDAAVLKLALATYVVLGSVDQVLSTLALQAQLCSASSAGALVLAPSRKSSLAVSVPSSSHSGTVSSSLNSATAPSSPHSASFRGAGSTAWTSVYSSLVPAVNLSSAGSSDLSGLLELFLAVRIEAMARILGLSKHLSSSASGASGPGSGVNHADTGLAGENAVCSDGLNAVEKYMDRIAHNKVEAHVGEREIPHTEERSADFEARFQGGMQQASLVVAACC